MRTSSPLVISGATAAALAALVATASSAAADDAVPWTVTYVSQPVEPWNVTHVAEAHPGAPAPARALTRPAPAPEAPPRASRRVARTQRTHHSAGSTLVTVASGDTLWGLAARSGTTWPRIVADNAACYPSLQDNPGLIIPGWKFVVRAASAAAE